MFGVRLQAELTALREKVRRYESVVRRVVEAGPEEVFEEFIDGPELSERSGGWICASCGEGGEGVDAGPDSISHDTDCLYAAARAALKGETL